MPSTRPRLGARLVASTEHGAGGQRRRHQRHRPRRARDHDASVGLRPVRIGDPGSAAVALGLAAGARRPRRRRPLPARRRLAAGPANIADRAVAGRPSTGCRTRRGSGAPRRGHSLGPQLGCALASEGGQPAADAGQRILEDLSLVPRALVLGAGLRTRRVRGHLGTGLAAVQLRVLVAGPPDLEQQVAGLVLVERGQRLRARSARRGDARAGTAWRRRFGSRPGVYTIPWRWIRWR